MYKKIGHSHNNTPPPSSMQFDNIVDGQAMLVKNKRTWNYHRFGSSLASIFMKRLCYLKDAFLSTRDMKFTLRTFEQVFGVRKTEIHYCN